MARESSLWAWLAQARVKITAPLHMGRIENFLEAGTPDVEGFAVFDDCSGQFWIELKSEERPARPKTPIRFKLKNRDAQIEWLRKRWEIGGNAFFLLQVGSGADRILYLAPGDAGQALREGLTESELLILCSTTGVFRPPFSHEKILKRVLLCRANPYCPFPK